ncbi:hypothetical protein TNCV_3828551 [Trichonephila clavipes]|nr:hypothetical protein TNCV_3828551 [Trichonephila clavipes]
MTQERLSDLAVISLKSEISKEKKRKNEFFTEAIDKFASQKARKVTLLLIIRILSSRLVSREWDNRNRWWDGQVCPDVGKGIMAPWSRRPGIRGKCPALDRENLRGEPWLERTGREPSLERT